MKDFIGSIIFDEQVALHLHTQMFSIIIAASDIYNRNYSFIEQNKTIAVVFNTPNIQ
jgi:hypothetical protein